MDSLVRRSLNHVTAGFVWANPGGSLTSLKTNEHGTQLSTSSVFTGTTAAVLPVSQEGKYVTKLDQPFTRNNVAHRVKEKPAERATAGYRCQAYRLQGNGLGMICVLERASATWTTAIMSLAPD